MSRSRHRLAPGNADLFLSVPDDLDVRARDRFFDLYLHEPMGRIVLDMLRPGAPATVAASKQMLVTAYARKAGAR